MLAQDHPKTSISDVTMSKSGKKVRNMNSKLKLLADCYTELYKSTHPCGNNIEDFLKDVELPELSEEKQQRLNSNITYLEIETALLQMKLGKTPGLCGLPIEFYRTFKEELMPYIGVLLQYCYLEVVIPPSWEKSKIGFNS